MDYLAVSIHIENFAWTCLNTLLLVFIVESVPVSTILVELFKSFPVNILQCLISLVLYFAVLFQSGH
jgi:hypothetical protein